jgi:hypothetical protein
MSCRLVREYNYTTLRSRTIEESFNYYMDVEAFPERYPKHCVRVKVQHRSIDSVTTREVWNISLFQVDYVSIKVRYNFIPNKAIQYEIIEGYGQGTKNEINLEPSQYGTLVCGCLPMRDIIALLVSRQTEVWDNSPTYFMNQDSIMLEGKMDQSFKNGDLCIICRKGNISIHCLAHILLSIG